MTDSRERQLRVSINRLLLTAGVFGFVLFFVPIRSPAALSCWTVSPAVLYHVLYFAFLAASLLYRMHWHHAIAIWGAVAGLAALVEWMQPFAGRSCELSDWLYGAVGAAVVCMLCKGRSATKDAGFTAFGLAAIIVIPAVRQTIVHGMPERHSFPVVADFAAGWGSSGWDLHEVALGFGGDIQCDASVDSLQYPGLFRQPTVRDWSTFSILGFQVLWPEKKPVVLGVRIDDLPDNPPYGDRYQQHFTLTNGWNGIRMADIGTGKTPGGRLLDWHRVHEWGVFLVSPPHFDYFRLSNVVLERNPDEDSTP